MKHILSFISGVVLGVALTLGSYFAVYFSVVQTVKGREEPCPCSPCECCQH